MLIENKLYQLIDIGDENQVAQIIQKRPTLIYKVGMNGWTPFHSAVEKNNEKIVKLFLKTVLDRNKKIDNQLSGFQDLKEDSLDGDDGNINEIMRATEKLKVNIQKLITSRQEHGVSPMHVALHFRCYSIIEYFRNFVECDVVDIKKSISLNDSKLLKSLIKNDQELLLEDGKQRSIPHFVIKYIYSDNDKIKFLDPLIEKININKPDYLGATALHYAYAQKGQKTSISYDFCDDKDKDMDDEKMKLITYLEQNKADPLLMDNLGYTVTDWEKAEGNPDVEKPLVNKPLRKKSSIKKLIDMIKKVSNKE